MIRLRAFVLCCLFHATLQSVFGQNVRLDASPQSAEMIQLVDGQTLAGWHGLQSIWSARDGELIGQSNEPLATSVRLVTERHFSEFRLLGEVRIERDSQVAIAFGASCLTTNDEPATVCEPRVVVLNNELLRAGVDEWTPFELLVVGQRVRVAVNGRLQAELVGRGPASVLEPGPIALQLQPTEKAARVRFRQVFVETFPGPTLQTVAGDAPVGMPLRQLVRVVDSSDTTIERWTKLTEALVPEALLLPVRGTRLPLTSMGVRDVEREAYYALVQKARELPLATLHHAADEWRETRRALPEHRRYARLPREKFPTFADLFRNPEPYHGKLVTLRGHVRQLDEMPADANPYGIERLYQAWLFDEHAQSNPVVIVCTTLDPRLIPEPETLLNHCRATGYFFKNMAYDGQRDLRFAPLLIAQKLEYFPPENTAPGIIDSVTESLVQVTGLSRKTFAVIGVLMLCGLSLFVVRRKQRRPIPAQTAAPTFDNLPDAGGPMDFSRLERGEDAAHPSVVPDNVTPQSDT